VLSDINAVCSETQNDDTTSKKSDKSALIHSLLDGLSERHQIIIRGLYGLNEDGLIKTHNEIGRELGLKTVSVIRSHDIIINRLGLLATAESANY
jgi:DNA-directed RNA polymerase specialized sigma subunit